MLSAGQEHGRTQARVLTACGVRPLSPRWMGLKLDLAATPARCRVDGLQSISVVSLGGVIPAGFEGDAIWRFMHVQRKQANTYFNRCICTECRHPLSERGC